VERDFRIAQGLELIALGWSEDGSSFARRFTSQSRYGAPKFKLGPQVLDWVACLNTARDKKNESFAISWTSNHHQYKFATNVKWFNSICRHPVALVFTTVSLFGLLDLVEKTVEKSRSRAKQNYNRKPSIRRSTMENKLKDLAVSSIAAVKESVMHGGMGMALVSF
jgi:hypothetical protein